MTVKLYKLNPQVITTFECYIQSHLKDDEFKSLFLRFFQDDYSKLSFTKQDRTAIHNSFEKFLINIFRNYKIELCSWEQYCLGMKWIRAQDWDDRAQKLARKMLSDLYHYITENINLDTEKFAEIKEHTEFLIWKERKLSKMSEGLLDTIGTNFPLKSSLKQLHYIPADNKSDAFILNLNIPKGEIKSVLLGFYQSEKHQHLNLLRHFLYLFRYSLISVEKEPQCIADFTFAVFKKQFRFYKKMDTLNIAHTYNRNNGYKFSQYLVRFYIYLCKIIKEQHIPHNIFEGTLYNEHILGNTHFTVHYEQGYRLIAYNPFEKVPFENRWQLIPINGYANIKKNRPYGMDFLKVKEQSFREDLKHYVWKQTSMSVNSVGNSIYMLIDFLNFISSYKQLNKVNGYVDLDLLEQWGFYISSKETSTRNNYIKSCKSYLKFYKDKYQIPKLLIDSLKKKPENLDGGNPMTRHDVDLFSEKFQEQRSQSVMGELCYIIFNLAATTKLRLGEILALERDCIAAKYIQAGVIHYHSKVTGNQKINLTLAIEKINLIERAIHLTKDAHSKATRDIAKYIFLKEDTLRKDRIITLVYQFITNFNKIQKELYGQLDGKYRAYDLRTTFIDTVYTEGINDGLSTSIIAEMAGNGVQTAKKYYRKATAAQEYAEMFAGVTISGVDIYGHILEERDFANLNPVERELGGCTQEGCVIDDEKYECLICPYFATTANRIPLFKQNITRLKTLKESTLNSQERTIIDSQIKLYTIYYSKLLEKIGGE